MTFDIIFQGFIAGESSEQGGSQMREILAPHVTDEDGSFLRVRFGDGDADIYLGDDRMMANHVSGRDPWDLLVEGAQAANWVIMPIDCPTCVTQPGHGDSGMTGHFQRGRSPHPRGDVDRLLGDVPDPLTVGLDDPLRGSADS